MPKRKKINLALQGGGAHGAFTWGLLDKFLESKLFTIEGISATSAGSMNAAVLAYGFLQGREEGARQSLYDFWHAMSDYGKVFGITAKTPFDYFIEPFLKAPLNFYLFNSIASLFSPYQFNPFNFHPIRNVLEKIIDVEQIKNKSAIKLFICATNVQTGKIRIFDNNELSIDTLLASACLPQLYQSIEVNGEFYWDGGYLGNPAIFPLIYQTSCRDILIFHTVPIVRNNIPKTPAEIDSRVREVSFNSSLMREMRAVAFVSSLITQGQLKKEYEKGYKKIFMHCIRADEDLRDFPLSTVYTPDWEFLVAMRDLGRQEASLWIEKNYEKVGKKTTIDFAEWL
ncbi:phospholipase, patatin family [Legionella sainthelensi]|uniref:Phospholipase, patatin family n=1 Tax=Legionella sainthelensi TaxID=28087 RepID=A0A0W0YTF3_9GAMM|nr:patatin-like phospholipase family protein [Legionella sainthelensi]KTD60187.1 phospholipase, patatin family [Legionella sainthelensi]VEH32411.1 phospholipase, patatin family [Legionella sainthelensi]